jgi:PAS domain S-box-containing protein
MPEFVNPTVAVVSGNEHLCGALCEMLRSLDLSPLTFSTDADMAATFKDNPPAAIAVDADDPDGIHILEHLSTVLVPLRLIAVCQQECLAAVRRRLKGRVFEFLSRPLDANELEATLDRIAYTASLAWHPQEDQQVATERFLGIRQVIDKLSSFISMVATDVQGGIKYFNELPYFVSIHSSDCQVLAANNTYTKYLGNRIYENSWGIYSGKRATRNGCPVGRALKAIEVRSTRALVRYKSGARVPVTVHTAPIYDDSGNVSLILEMFAGTKEIEKLANEIKSTQQRYEQLFDAVPSQLVVIDRRFGITAANRKFIRNFGDQIGNNFFNVLRPASFPAYRDPVTRTVRTGQPQQGEMVMTDASGTKQNMMAWTSPITTAAGKLIQVLVIFADITELRRLQQNLATLGLMLGTVSHDLKGSLTGLDAGLYLMETGFYRDRPGRIEEGLDLTKLMAERIRKLIYDILYYAKDRELERERIDVTEFVADLIANIEHKARGAGISLVCDINQNMGEFEVDPSLLRAAMTNILDNAIEACIENPHISNPEIKLKAWHSQNEIRFSITDTGSGLQKEAISHLFDLFYSSKGRAGTGIGLFMTKKAVQKHGGTIQVTSEPAKGTRFQIAIPQQTENFEIS